MIEELMEVAAEKIKQRLPEGWCTDDWQWNSRCFQFVVIKGSGMNAVVTDPYRFCYRDDEEFYGTGVEQLDERIESWF